MNELVNIKTMSSREIAELTGKEHKNVLADIKKTIAELEASNEIGRLKFQLSCYTNAQNKEQPEFLLCKEASLLIVSGYSLVLRKRIIQRWSELEEKTAKQQLDIQTLSGLMALYREYLPNLSQNSLQTILSIATKEMTGTELLPLPTIKEKRYTVTEMAGFFGVSRQKLGRVISELGLRNSEYSECRLSKSEHSNKQVEQHFYNEQGFNILKGKFNHE